MKMDKKNSLPMTLAFRALNAAKAVYEPRIYPFILHGGTVQAAKELNLDHHATIKTIILEDDSKKPFVCLMHGDKEISTKQLARILGVKFCQPCAPETAQRHSGYLVGGTSPFGTRKRMRVLVEETIYSLPEVYINGGHRGVLVVIKPEVIDQVLGDLVTRVNVAID